MAQRKPGGSAGGKWEFPGGKVETGESPQAALAREILEELECTVEVHEWIGRGVFEPDDRLIVLDVYRCALLGPPPDRPGHSHDSIVWAGSIHLPTFDWAPADVPIVPRVVSLLSRSRAGATKGSHD